MSKFFVIIASDYEEVYDCCVLEVGDDLPSLPEVRTEWLSVMKTSSRTDPWIVWLQNPLGGTFTDEYESFIKWLELERSAKRVGSEFVEL